MHKLNTSTIYVLDTIGHKKGWHTDIVCFKEKVILSRDISHGWLHSSFISRSTNSRDVAINLLASTAVKNNSGSMNDRVHGHIFFFLILETHAENITLLSS